MHTYLLKKNNKAYSFEELTDKEIKGSTVLKYEGAEEWTTAKELPELHDLITVNASYKKARPALKKREFTLGVGLIFLFPLLQMFIPVEGYRGEESISIYSDAKMYAHILVAALLVITSIRFLLTRRYYRLIKVVTKSSQKTKISYQIQSCISYQRNSENLNEDILKWNTKKPINTFSDQKKAEAKNAFDNLTSPKKISEEVKKDPKERNTPPYLLEKLQQEWRYFIAPSTKLKNTFFFLFAIGVSGMFMYICLSKVSLLHSSEKEALFMPIFQTVLMVLGIVVLVYFILKKTPLPGYTCYVRLIERTEGEGQFKYSVHKIQYLITRKRSNEVTASNSLKWRDIQFRDLLKTNAVNQSSKLTSKKDLLKIYHKKTDQIVSVTHAAVD